MNNNIIKVFIIAFIYLINYNSNNINYFISTILKFHKISWKRILKKNYTITYKYINDFLNDFFF